MARCSSCLHRPENYSAHKLLNAKSFDFNYVENFYCPRRLRMRKRRTFAQLFLLPGCVCLSIFRIFPLSFTPSLYPSFSVYVGFFGIQLDRQINFNCGLATVINCNSRCPERARDRQRGKQSKREREREREAAQLDCLSKQIK